MEKKQLPYQNEPGFKVPKNYFADFEASLFEKLEVGSEKEAKTTSGYLVPKNYFADFQMDAPKTSRTKVVPLFNKKNLVYAASIAAVFVLIFSIFTQETSPETLFSNIAHETMEKYLEYERTEFSNLELENIELKDPDFHNLDKEILFEYLMDPVTEITFVNE